MGNFKENVAAFQSWFEENESRVRKLVDGEKAQEAYDLVAPEIQKAMGDIAFQVYKNPVTRRHSLEFVTFLDDSKKVVCFYFCDILGAALKGKWDFFYYHPAMKGSLTYGGRTYLPEEFHIVPSLNKKTMKIDIIVSNKKDFQGLSDQDKFMITYMLLSDYIGEMCVDAYIGGISFGKPSLFKKTGVQNEVELGKLYDYIVDTVSGQGWIKPGDIKLIASSFKSQKSKTVQERQDFEEGLSYCVDILNEEGSPDPILTDYIKSLGIGIYSICTQKDLMDEKKSKARKDEVEKKLSGLLSRGKSGFTVHSIKGKAHDYADFFLYDDKVLPTIEREIIAEGSGSKLLTL